MEQDPGFQGQSSSLEQGEGWQQSLALQHYLRGGSSSPCAPGTMHTSAGSSLPGTAHTASSAVSKYEWAESKTQQRKYTSFPSKVSSLRSLNNTRLSIILVYISWTSRQQDYQLISFQIRKVFILQYSIWQ